jgi:hypothetical protein
MIKNEFVEPSLDTQGVGMGIGKGVAFIIAAIVLAYAVGKLI